MVAHLCINTQDIKEAKLYTNCSCCCSGKDKQSFYPEKVCQLSREDNMSRTRSSETRMYVYTWLELVIFISRSLLLAAHRPNMPFRTSPITAGHETSNLYMLIMYIPAPACHAIEPTGQMVYSHEIAHVELARWLIALLSACEYRFRNM